MYNTRIDNLKERTVDTNSIVLIKSKVNRYYYSSCWADDGLLILAPIGDCLLVDGRFIEVAQKDSAVKAKLSGSQFYKSVYEYIENCDIKLIGLEYESTSLSDYAEIAKQFPNAKFFDVSVVINEQREIKDEYEIKCITKAQRVCETAYTEMLKTLKAGISEKELALQMEMFIRNNGCESVSFDFIVLFGENTSLPHGVPGERKLKDGDVVTLDFGGKYNGYCSDMTRSFVFGKASERVATVFNTVLKAQESALLAIKAGITGAEVDKIARDIITDAGFGEYFNHGLGHGVGLEIHEAPRLSKNGIKPLRSGQVVTVEPGIYIPGEFGVRIEDMVVVSNESCDNLTQSIKYMDIF